VSPEPGLIAEPEPAARFGKRARFLLSAGGARRGLAVATVKAIAAVPRARRAIARDEVIGGDAVDLSAGALTPLHIRALPSAGDVVGLTARRDIAPGEVLIAAVLRRPPLVRSGDEVTASLRVGAVVVTAVGHASGSGQAGDVIRVSQPNSSRLLKGRITGPGAVEIVE
jgi:flagella basal body P-ring formation protein FlgA